MSPAERHTPLGSPRSPKDIKAKGRDAKLPGDLLALRGLSRAMDEAITLPIVGLKVGLDPLLGLIPGVGDGAGAFISASHLIAGLRHRVPTRVLLRMVLNIAFDMLLGVVPGFGDIADVFYRHHTKNFALIVEHRDLSRPPREVPIILKTLVVIGLLVPTILVAGLSVSLGVLFLGPLIGS